MIKNQDDDIADDIRENLPILFGKTEAIDRTLYFENRSELKEYAFRVTGSLFNYRYH